MSKGCNVYNDYRSEIKLVRKTGGKLSQQGATAATLFDFLLWENSQRAEVFGLFTLLIQRFEKSLEIFPI